MEDLNLVLHIRSLFCTLQSVPGAIFSDLVSENPQERRQEQDYRYMTPMQAFPTAASPSLIQPSSQPPFASQQPFLFTYPIPTPQFSANIGSNNPGVVPSNLWDITSHPSSYLQPGIQSGNFQSMKSVSEHPEGGHGGASSSSKAHLQRDDNSLESLVFPAGESSPQVVASFATKEDAGFLGEGHGRPPGVANSKDISYSLSGTSSNVDLDSLLVPTDAFEECGFGSLMPPVGEGIDRFFSLLPKDHSEEFPSIASRATSSIETQVTGGDSKLGTLTLVQSRELQQPSTHPACSEVSTVLERRSSILPEELNTDERRGVKRARPREPTRQRPRDRQQIQDRIKELRDIVPDAVKCSIHMLLEKTIKHMQFLQSVMQHSTQQEKEIRNGASWAIKMDGGSNSQDRCPIFVKDLSEAGQILVEVICQEKNLFLEMAGNIRSLGLVILKDVMETRNGNVWGRFVVEASQDVRRFDVMCSLVRLLERNKSATGTNFDVM